MPNLPPAVSRSGLWQRLDANPELQNAIAELRTTSEFIGAKAGEVVPEFTDHSIRHMDALWSVCDTVLTPTEMDRLSPGEAFVLGSSFYVHDLGMALAATAAGIDELKSSLNYADSFRRLTVDGSISENDAHIQALRSSARELHAKLAVSFIDEILPGLDRYLIQNKDIRDRWGAYIGEVASSHHWSLRELDVKLGARGAVPDPIQGRTDLAFVACILRVVDYAHINADRALRLDRALRSRMPPASLLHWQAQENITGPVREGHQIEYGCARPIASISAWWTFFELARGLDTEIKDVGEFLAQRNISAGRFSLEGVRGASSPRQFATLVLPQNFEPIDVRVRSSSMDRLVALLGGKALYGNDPMAAVRELVQNAADAVRLRRATEAAAGLTSIGGEISVSLDVVSTPAVLVVADDGIGMSERVVTQYLLNVASDYWHSSDFDIDHPGVASAGFKPIGRFGIGFLSVFMLGRDISVQTQRAGETALRLELEGVGSRGAIQRRPTSIRGGTSVEVKVEPEVLPKLTSLSAKIQARAPMLDMPVTVRSGDAKTTIEPEWWRALSQEEFKRFIVEYGRDESQLALSRIERFGMRPASDEEMLQYLAREARSQLDNPLMWWPKSQPEVSDSSSRIMAVPTMGKVILCSRGFAVSEMHIGGYMGLIDIPDISLNAARNRALAVDESKVCVALRERLLPSILASMSDLNNEPSIHERYDFIVRAASAYGTEVLCNTDLQWIYVVTPPGDARLLKPTDFSERVARENEVLIGYRDVTPWSISAHARTHFPESSPRALRILVAGTGSGDIRSNEPYHERETIKKMPLVDHLRIGHSTRGRDNDGAPIPPLLMGVVTLIAHAWGMPVDHFTRALWSSKQNVLCGYFTR